MYLRSGSMHASMLSLGASVPIRILHVAGWLRDVRRNRNGRSGAWLRLVVCHVSRMNDALRSHSQCRPSESRVEFNILTDYYSMRKSKPSFAFNSV